ncbi:MULTISPECIES: hypothetical protein [unclassified Spirosoma]|uniref:hypothetical protein n=1 Tax=unclassified Spirosoma TaxID=2621999 RepID=UPI000A9BA8E2|nr:MULTISPECIES: hypothetical protein [unclassified Spirosoma]MBN8824556.1 hypothetical protein [Spirosoma sp.]
MSTNNIHLFRQRDPDERPPVRLTITAYAVLFTAFLGLFVLKLSGFVDWSWWWISSPLWLGPIGQSAWIVRDRFRSGRFSGTVSRR